MNKRIVITGLGVFSPVGIGADAYWRALMSGTSGVGLLTRFDVGELPVRTAAEVADFKPREYVPKEHRKALKVMSRDVQLGVAAAMSAVEDARIITDQKRVDPDRLGICFGSGHMASDIDEMGQAFAESVKDPAQGVDLRTFGLAAMKSFFPLWLLKYLPNMPACHTSIFIDARGPNNSITSGDASSAQAIGEGCRVIERAAADVMVTGGQDAKVNPVSLIRYLLLNQLTTADGKPETLSRPFEKLRGGFVIGEGSAAVVLEDYEHAKTRGATIYGEIAGFGTGCDAHDVTRSEPDARGLQVAMKAALRDAKCDPSDVDAVFAAAKGSVADDRAESRALNAVFGDGSGAPPVTSTKSMLGFISAATGVMDVVAAVGALKEGRIPPTINYDEPDPECPVNVVGNTSREARLDNILVNSGGLGGQYACLVIRRHKS